MFIEEIQYKPNMFSDTRTYRDWSKYLGLKPTMLSQVVRQMPQYSTLYMMLGMNNRFTDKEFDMSGATKLDSVFYQWNIVGHTNQLMTFVESCTPPTTGGTEFQIILERKYATYRDVLKLRDGTNLFITQQPRKLADNRWSYLVKVIGVPPLKPSDPDERIITDLSLVAKGANIQWLGNIRGEGMNGVENLKNEGGSERHGNYLTRTDVKESSTGTYQRAYNVYIKKQGGDGTVEQGFEKFLMRDSFKQAQEQLALQINNLCLFGKSNTNAKGYSTLNSESFGEFPIHSVSGIIDQVERRGSKITYPVLTEKIFQDAIWMVAENSGQIRGNFLKFVCTDLMYKAVQRVMGKIANFLPATVDKDIFIATNRYGVTQRVPDAKTKSKNNFKANPDIKGIGNTSLGTTYSSYEFAGNVITFMPDDSLTNDIQFKGREYAILLNDALADGSPNLQFFTQKGLELIVTEVNGHGGQDGMTSGVASHDGDYRSKTLESSFSVAVKDPYRALIIEKARQY
jgi:hypothetical protein